MNIADLGKAVSLEDYKKIGDDFTPEQMAIFDDAVKRKQVMYELFIRYKYSFLRY